MDLYIQIFFCFPLNWQYLICYAGYSTSCYRNALHCYLHSQILGFEKTNTFMRTHKPTHTHVFQKIVSKDEDEWARGNKKRSKQKRKNNIMVWKALKAYTYNLYNLQRHNAKTNKKPKRNETKRNHGSDKWLYNCTYTNAKYLKSSQNGYKVMFGHLRAIHSIHTFYQRAQLYAPFFFLNPSFIR